VIGAVVNGGDLVEVMWSSFAAGLGVTVAYGVAILGASRAADHSRDGRLVRATAYGALAVVSVAAVLAAIVVGIVVMSAG
jgi:hypothetical protein